MRTVIQRVSAASITVDGQTVGRIGAGLCIFIGIGKDDNSDQAAALADKVKHLRIFEDQAEKMNRSVLDIGGEVLVSRSSPCTATATKVTGLRSPAPRCRPWPVSYMKNSPGA